MGGKCEGLCPGVDWRVGITRWLETPAGDRLGELPGGGGMKGDTDRDIIVRLLRAEK